jgi:2-isopropylmalate synthase
LKGVQCEACHGPGAKHAGAATADKKKTITDADLEALIADEVYQPRDVYTLDGLQVACGTMGMPTATVRLRDPQGGLHIQACVGTGPVDATYKAIDTVIHAPNTLEEFVVHADRFGPVGPLNKPSGATLQSLRPHPSPATPP